MVNIWLKTCGATKSLWGRMSWIRMRGSRLLVDPAIEVLAGLDVDAQEHLRVLRPAVLRALPQVEPCLARLDPHLVRVVWNQIGLAGEARHPEAVVGIRREQVEEGRLADGQVQLVRGDDLQPRVPILPPELVADDGHLERAFRARSVLDAEDDSRRGEEEHQHDDDRSDGPGQLHLGASIDLSRLATIVVVSPPELHDRVRQQPGDDGENYSGDREHKQRQLEDRSSGSRDGSEDLRRAPGWPRSRSECHPHRHHCDSSTSPPGRPDVKASMHGWCRVPRQGIPAGRGSVRFAHDWGVNGTTGTSMTRQILRQLPPDASLASR